MASYLVKRVLMALLALLIITCVTFIIMNLVPGGPFMSEKAPSPEVLAALEAKYGLNKPIGEQLINYLKDVLRGDFGVSFRMQKNRPVIEIIQDLCPVSARVGLFAVINAVLIGIPIGCLAAYNRGKVLDSALRVVMTIGISIPSFVVATLLLILLSVNLKILPGMGLTDWRNYIMPCFALSFYPMCYIGRMTRSSMLDAINADYIRTARAKGLSSGRIIFKHALRNSLIPVVTYIGPMIAYLLTGGFVVETVFSIPGLGRYFIQSILNRDYPIIMGTTVFLAAFVIMMNLVVDILYKVIDPRINLSNGGEA